MLETTLGRALFNEALPDDYAYADYEVGKKQLGQIVNDLAERYPKIEVANCLDQLKDSVSTGPPVRGDRVHRRRHDADTPPRSGRSTRTGRTRSTSSTSAV